MQDNRLDLGTYTIENRVSGLAVVQRPGPRLWTPSQGPSGLLIVPALPALNVVFGGRIIEVNSATPGDPTGADTFARRVARVMLGGIVIVSNARQKEPTRIVGHPDLASGASVQRGDILYVSVAEAVYRESRGEDVEIHLAPSDDDHEALTDLRRRARQRWENDRLPDGWTRPLPSKSPASPMVSKENSLEPLPDELRELATRFRGGRSRQNDALDADE